MFSQVGRLGVNLINGLHAHFSYESSFKDQTLSREKTFVQKMRAKNVDEIDYRFLFEEGMTSPEFT